MHTELLRVSIIGPDYRSSILAHSYSIELIKETNQISFIAYFNCEEFTLDIDYSEASNYQVTVAAVGFSVPTQNFTLAEAFKPKSA